MIEKLQKYIHKNHLSLRDVASLCGCSPSTLSRILRGIGAPDKWTEERIQGLLSGRKDTIERYQVYGAIQARMADLEKRVKRLETMGKPKAWKC